MLLNKEVITGMAAFYFNSRPQNGSVHKNLNTTEWKLKFLFPVALLNMIFAAAR